MKNKKIKILAIIGVTIWFGFCGFGFYKSISSDDYFLMLHYKYRLEARSHYIDMCHLCQHNKLEGKIAHIKHLKGGAKIIEIEVLKDSDNGFLTDYTPLYNPNIFSIRNGSVVYRIDYDYKGKNIKVGDKVFKSQNSNTLQFINSNETFNINFLHYYSDTFVNCQDALKMKINEEFKNYIYHLDKSGSNEKLYPHVLKELEGIK